MVCRKLLLILLQNRAMKIMVYYTLDSATAVRLKKVILFLRTVKKKFGERLFVSILPEEIVRMVNMEFLKPIRLQTNKIPGHSKKFMPMDFEILIALPGVSQDKCLFQMLVTGILNHST